MATLIDVGGGGVSQAAFDAHVESNEHVFVAVKDVTSGAEIKNAVSQNKQVFILDSGEFFMADVGSGGSEVDAYITCMGINTQSSFDRGASPQIKVKMFSVLNSTWTEMDGYSGEITATTMTRTSMASVPELVDGFRYRPISSVGAYHFTMPNGHASGVFRTDASPAITFEPTAKFLGAVPEFKPSTTYEFDVQDNVWVFTEVVSQ